MMHLFKGRCKTCQKSRSGDISPTYQFVSLPPMHQRGDDPGRGCRLWLMGGLDSEALAPCASRTSHTTPPTVQLDPAHPEGVLGRY